MLHNFALFVDLEAKSCAHLVGVPLYFNELIGIDMPTFCAMW